MMKKLLACLLALLTVAALSACSKENGENKNDISGLKQEEVVFTSVAIGNSTFYFRALDTTQVEITGYAGPNDVHDITIPATVQTGSDAASSTKAVTAIADEAFANVSALRSVVIPEGVVSIGTHAFAGCVQLESVTFPSSIKTIGTAAFYKCGLTSLTFPESCGLTEIADSAFYACEKLVEVTIPAYIKTIGSASFYGCTSMKKVVISEGVETVGKQAFQNNTALEDLSLPSTMKNTDPLVDFSFSNCTALYRDRVICNGEAANAYADKMPIDKTAPVEDPDNSDTPAS